MGCLLPQEDNVLDFPATVTHANRPPRIVALLAPSQPFVTMNVGSNCPNTEFSVLVEDEDIENTLYARWFLDEDESGVTGNYRESAPVGQNKQEVRAVTFSISRSAFKENFGLLPGGQPGQGILHFLRVVVADRPFAGPDPIPVPDPLPDGGFDPAFTDTFLWGVTAEQVSSDCL